MVFILILSVNRLLFSVAYHLSKDKEKTIDRKPQNHCSQNQGKYHLIGTEFLHRIGLRECTIRAS